MHRVLIVDDDETMHRLIRLKKLRVPLRIEGKDNAGEIFNTLTTTENVSRTSFLCSWAVALEDGTMLDVFLARGANEHAGTARVIRSEWNETVYPRYASRFTEPTENWVFG